MGLIEDEDQPPEPEGEGFVLLAIGLGVVIGLLAAFIVKAFFGITL